MQEIWTGSGPFLSGVIVGGTVGFIAGLWLWIWLGLWRGSYWDRADIEAQLRSQYGAPLHQVVSAEEMERVADRKHLKMLLEDSEPRR